MKVLLDEMLPAGVAALLPEHEAVTVHRAGFKGLANGELMRRAAESGYAVLLTADRSLPSQQNVGVSGLAVVLVRGSRMAELTVQAERIRTAVASARSGTVTRVEPR